MPHPRHLHVRRPHAHRKQCARHPTGFPWRWRERPHAPAYPALPLGQSRHCGAGPT
nr:MAG TPA: hypothetical protein [Caudoviricetes sp.]